MSRNILYRLCFALAIIGCVCGQAVTVSKFTLDTYTATGQKNLCTFGTLTVYTSALPNTPNPPALTLVGINGLSTVVFNASFISVYANNQYAYTGTLTANNKFSTSSDIRVQVGGVTALATGSNNAYVPAAFTCYAGSFLITDINATTPVAVMAETSGCTFTFSFSFYFNFKVSNIGTDTILIKSGTNSLTRTITGTAPYYTLTITTPVGNYSSNTINYNSNTYTIALPSLTCQPRKAYFSSFKFNSDAAQITGNGKCSYNFQITMGNGDLVDVSKFTSTQNISITADPSNVNLYNGVLTEDQGTPSAPSVSYDGTQIIGTGGNDFPALSCVLSDPSAISVTPDHASEQYSNETGCTFQITVQLNVSLVNSPEGFTVKSVGNSTFNSTTVILNGDTLKFNITVDTTGEYNYEILYTNTHQVAGNLSTVQPETLKCLLVTEPPTEAPTTEPPTESPSEPVISTTPSPNPTKQAIASTSSALSAGILYITGLILLSLF